MTEKEIITGKKEAIALYYYEMWIEDKEENPSCYEFLKTRKAKLQESKVISKTESRRAIKILSDMMREAYEIECLMESGNLLSI